MDNFYAKMILMLEKNLFFREQGEAGDTGGRGHHQEPNQPIAKTPRPQSTPKVHIIIQGKMSKIMVPIKMSADIEGWGGGFLGPPRKICFSLFFC